MKRESRKQIAHRPLPIAQFTGQSAVGNRQFRRGLTLVEAVLSMGILGIVLLGTQGAVMLASKAVPDAKSASFEVMTGCRVVDMITADLHYATAITTMSGNEIVMTVPDRNGDGASETVRYVWSGTALQRQYNGGALV